MKRNYVKYTSGAILTGLILFTSCQSTREVQANYEVAQIEGTRICMDSTWDAHPDEKAAALLKPYKEKIDKSANIKSIMEEDLPAEVNMLPQNFKSALKIFENSTFTKESLGKNLVYNFIEKRKKDLKIDEDIQELKYFLMD